MELGIFPNPTVTVVKVCCMDVFICYFRQDMEPFLQEFCPDQQRTEKGTYINKNTNDNVTA
jgi:hypothetical protein